MHQPRAHPLAALITEAAAGRYPAADGGWRRVPPWRPGLEGIVAFTGHAVLAVAPDICDARIIELGANGFGGAHDPRLVAALAGPDGWIDILDVLLAGHGTGEAGGTDAAGFMAALDPVNAAAEQAPGFIWRLQTEDGNATAIRAFEWDAAGSAGVIVNMSVWTSAEHLGAFVCGKMHRQIMRRRREWFCLMREAYLACWWVPAGHRPGTGEAEDRIRYLRALGPTPHAFNLRVSYPPPGGVDGREGGGAGDQPVRGPGEWLCPA
jgi:hypothetical protein